MADGEAPLGAADLLNAFYHSGWREDPALEHRGHLSKAAVQHIMGQEEAAIWPRPRHPADRAVFPVEYHVVLRRLATGQEYMHPAALPDLGPWHMFFMECALLADVDLARHPAFPQLTPPTMDTPVTCVEFTKQAVRFRATATVAVAGASEDVMGTALLMCEPPSGPVDHAAFRGMQASSQRRRACLRNSAMMALAEESGFLADVAAPLDPAALAGGEHAELFQRLTLEHGPDAVGGGAAGVRRPRLFGEVDFFQREASAGSVTIPLALQHLHFLAPAVRRGVRYHIKAVSKYAYAVRLQRVGVWEAFVAVNMDMSLAAARQLFRGTGAAALTHTFPDVAYPVPPPRAEAAAAAASHQHRLVLRARERVGAALAALGVPYATEADREALDADAYALYLQWVGLALERSELTAVAAATDQRAEAERGRRFTALLLRGPGAAVSAADREGGVWCLFKVCEGLVGEVWRLTATVPDFVAALTGPPAAGGGLPDLTRARFDTFVRSCARGLQPDRWWQVALGACGEGDAYVLARALLHRAPRLLQLYPEWFFGPAADWRAEVDRVAVMNPDLGFARDDGPVLQDPIRLAAAMAAIAAAYPTPGDPQRAVAQAARFVGPAAFMLLRGDAAGIAAIRPTPRPP